MGDDVVKNLSQQTIVYWASLLGHVYLTGAAGALPGDPAGAIAGRKVCKN